MQIERATDGDKLVGAWISDGKRVRTIVSAAGAAHETFDVSLWPQSPRLIAGDQLDEVTSISAYRRIEGESDAPIAEISPDWMEAIDVLWIERVTP